MQALQTTHIPNVSINRDQRLYVIANGGGFSCLGFDVAFKHLAMFQERLGLEAPAEASIGTAELYETYQKQLRAYSDKFGHETFFDPGTPVAVKAYLESARKTRDRIRIFYGDQETGRDWMEENDVLGRVGRSTGYQKVPLLVATSRSSGGGAILTNCIVRIVHAETRRELYRHPKYHLAALTMHPSSMEGYETDVHANGVLHARFKTPERAQRWIAFMKGERMIAH